jgi:diaminopimelate decarboxylase
MIGGCDLDDLAREHGTPLVVYDEGHLRRTAHAFVDAMARHAPGGEVIYASKAYWGLAMLRLAHESGLAVDVASGGELHAARAAGVPAERIYMHGNNKDDHEVQELLSAGVGTVILDGFDELERLERAAAQRGVSQRVLIRVTPGVSGDTHEYISTGQVDSKFGFPLASGDADVAIDQARRSEHLALAGLHVHIGSQLLELSGFRSAAAVLARLVASAGPDDLGLINMGGGLGVAYTRGQQPPSIDEFVGTVAESVRSAWAAEGLGMPRLAIEPGRAMVARAGVTVYRVGGVKDIPGVRRYVSVDGGMSDLLRPMLYGATYEALRVTAPEDPPGAPVRLVGKHCESGDVLVSEAHLPEVEVGDLVCLAATGAYGVAMASNYNGIARAAVLFVDAGRARVVTRRETYADLLSREQ